MAEQHWKESSELAGLLYLDPVMTSITSGRSKKGPPAWDHSELRAKYIFIFYKVTFIPVKPSYSNKESLKICTNLLRVVSFIIIFNERFPVFLDTVLDQ